MDLNITHSIPRRSSFLLLLPSLYLFKTSPHGERSISNSNDYSYYENPAKVKQSPYPLFDSVIFIIEYNKFVKMLNKDS